MEDVIAITPRVLVIDRGKMTYDGPLADLVRRTRPQKRVTFRFGGAVQGAAVDGLGGRVVFREEGHVILQVDDGDVNDVVTRAITSLPVIDLKVEDAPLDEVLADFFAAQADA
jgi:ABC-2 type transport system ATP-binding protein